jgi:hypothetical protein
VAVRKPMVIGLRRFRGVRHRTGVRSEYGALARRLSYALAGVKEGPGNANGKQKNIGFSLI